MRKNIEEFFLGLKEPNFLAMKLLLSLFSKFEDDEVSSRIVDNISVLSQYDIRLLYSEEAFSYIDTFDNSSRVDFAITAAGTEEIVCHEFGHLLLELFARGRFPKEFLEVNERCKKRILKKKAVVSNLFSQYRDEAYEELIKDRDWAMDFYERHPALKDEYFERFPDGDEDDMVVERLEDHYSLVSAFDNRIDNYNRVSNIVDAIFCGDNPFFLDYGCDDIECVLSMHADDYFENGNSGPLAMSFGEQFADYLVLRTYPERFKEANSKLHELLGDEWFDMMDNFYNKVTSRMVKRGKVYQYK